jgi:hypothetical protein
LLTHVSDAERVIGEMARVLKPNGVLVAAEYTHVGVSLFYSSVDDEKRDEAWIQEYFRLSRLLMQGKKTIGRGDDELGIRVPYLANVAGLDVFDVRLEVRTHLDGFSGYVRTIGCADEDKLIYTLSRIRHVTFVIGCIIDPGLDEGGRTSDFLLDFAGGLNGLLFLHNSVVDYDGEVLVGPLRGD